MQIMTGIKDFGELGALIFALLFMQVISFYVVKSTLGNDLSTKKANLLALCAWGSVWGTFFVTPLIILALQSLGFQNLSEFGEFIYLLTPFASATIFVQLIRIYSYKRTSVKGAVLILLSILWKVMLSGLGIVLMLKLLTGSAFLISMAVDTLSK